MDTQICANVPEGGGSQKRRLSRKASTASNVSSASQAPKPVVSVATSASQAPATKPVATEQPSKCEVVRSATPQKALPSSLPDVVSTEVVLVSSQPPVPSQETQQDWTDAQPRTPFTTPVPSPAPKKKKMDEARGEFYSFFLDGPCLRRETVGKKKATSLGDCKGSPEIAHTHFDLGMETCVGPERMLLSRVTPSLWIPAPWFNSRFVSNNNLGWLTSI